MEQVKRPKKPLMFYYTIVLIILILFNIIAMPYIKEKQIKDVDYGTFISMTEKKEIKKVELQQQDNTILFTGNDYMKRMVLFMEKKLISHLRSWLIFYPGCFQSCFL